MGLAFNRDILDEVAHRPWPLPDRPWIMRQIWHDLLFAHWPMDPASLRTSLPPGLELDLFEDRAWVGVVPFHMSNVTFRGVPPLPWLSAFPELNVRTYVRAGGMAGVYFYSLDAGNPLAVTTARVLYHLPYYTADIDVRLSGGGIAYRSRRRKGVPAIFEAEYAPNGSAARPPAGSLDEFLTERYCLYVADPAGALHRLEIHHPPWMLQPAEARITVNTMAAAAGLRLPDTPPLLYFSKRQDMVAWPMRRVDRSTGL